MPTTPTTPTTPIILAHQEVAFSKLRRAGTVCFSPSRENLPLQPRTNSLVVGPSGSGKSFLSRAVAESFGLECKAITVAEWMLLGSRSGGSQRTWNAIFEFLRKNRTNKGAVIFLDEVDKLTGTTDWEQFLRVEVFRLLDRSVPPDLFDSDEDAYDQTIFEEVENFLKQRTFIIAAGAFQHLWEGRKTLAGFGAEARPEAPTQDMLSQHLPRELVNRFRSEVVLLPPLSAGDYEAMLLSVAEKMPAHLQQRFIQIGGRMIPEARSNSQGVRFLEEVLANVLADEADALAQPPPPKKQSLWRPYPHQTFTPGVRVFSP